MPVVKLDDGSGSTFSVLEVDGHYLPNWTSIIPNQEELFRSIPTWAGKEEDILICAYPRAGTHWLWEITSMLVNGSADRIKLIKETAMLEAITKETFDAIPAPRVMNSHRLPRLLPRDMLVKRTKIIFVQRNPKDICVSCFHLHSKLVRYEFDGNFNDYVGRFIRGLVDFGSWFDYTLAWEKFIRDNPDHPVLVLNYEDLKQDGLSEINRICDFLGLKRDARLIEEIADKCEFNKMKAEKNILENKTDWKEGQPGMYRKGQIGDWKNWFTVAKSEQFDAMFTEKMKEASFSKRFA